MSRNCGFVAVATKDLFGTTQLAGRLRKAFIAYATLHRFDYVSNSPLGMSWEGNAIFASLSNSNTCRCSSALPLGRGVFELYSAAKMTLASHVIPHGEFGSFLNQCSVA